ncbi:MAG: hypothetical protein HDT22_07220 [Ruminococcus sp.]|nr:hypothetical protein [Ruminococcus sp.]
MNKELLYVSTLMKDACTNRVAMFSNENTAKHADEAIRKAHLDLLGGELTYQTWRNNKNQIFTIWEDFLSPTLPEAWKTSPFYKRLCEVRNGAIGEKNAFAVKDKSYLVAAKFSGGTWDVERQKVGRAKDIAIETEWSYIDCYEELDRFLKGYTTTIEMLNEVKEGFAVDMDNRIATVFNGMGAYLPAEFVRSGVYDKDTLTELIRLTRTANRKNVLVAGSQSAIGKIADGTNANWISDAAKDELATNGVVVKNLGIGCDAVVIPDSFVPYTYDFAGADDVLYVLPDEQLIKIFYEGDVRAKENSEKDNHDQTIDIQFQHRVGVELVTSQLFAKYTIA